MFLTNFLSEFIYCILNCYAHMNILQMEYAHYECKLLLFIIYQSKVSHIEKVVGSPVKKLKPYYFIFFVCYRST